MQNISDETWQKVGPANRRHYDVLEDEEEVSPILKECLQFLSSDAMFLFLSNVTGIKLHPLAESDSDSSPEESDDEGDKPEVRKSISPKAGPSTLMETEDNKNGVSPEKTKRPFNPRYVREVRKWKRGNYTLIRDDDEAEFGLDARLFFNVGNWSQDCGGYTSYIARDADEELLSVQPAENSLVLVYKDKETLKFVKRVTDEITSRMPNREFHDIALTYYD